MSADGPDSKKTPDDEPLPNSAVEDFFVKMKHDFRRPKPTEEAVAVALQAIQKLTGEALEQNVARSSELDAGAGCPRCGGANSSANRFCGYCGASLGQSKPAPRTEIKPEGAPSLHAQEQHFYHHHDHHHYFLDSDGNPLAGNGAGLLSKGTAPAEQHPQDNGDAEASTQKLVQNWSVFCNSKRLDDLVGLYSVDAIVLRPNEEPAHGSSAIRQLLEADLQAGLGEVELESADTGIVGEIACLTGRCKMLVPIAQGRRYEQTGKYLIVAKREQGEWKIVADSWSMDTTPREPASQNASVLPMRKPRK